MEKEFHDLEFLGMALKIHYISTAFYGVDFTWIKELQVMQMATLEKYLQDRTINRINS